MAFEEKRRTMAAGEPADLVDLLHAIPPATPRAPLHARTGTMAEGVRYGFIVICPRSSPPGKFFECTFT